MTTTRETLELIKTFKQTAQAALKNQYGFMPQYLKDIRIYDGNSRTRFKFEVCGKHYQFSSYKTGDSTTSADKIIVWVGASTVQQIEPPHNQVPPQTCENCGEQYTKRFLTTVNTCPFCNHVNSEEV